MKFNRWLYVLIIGCLPTGLLAQVPDTGKVKVKYPVAEYFQEKDFNTYNTLYTTIDTLHEGVQKYFPNNFTYSLGLAGRKIIFAPSHEIGFRSGFNNLDLFGYNKEVVNYYKARTPYTEVFALFGMKKEQFSKLLHTQNISKQWNIALNMLRIRSEGFYQRQNCTDNNIALTTNYVSKNNRYSLLANGIISSIKSDENGGIASDSLFEARLLENKKLIPVNLMDARTKRRHREIYIKQSLYFGKKENVMKGDSIIGSRIRPTSLLSYSFNANDSEFSYTETKLDSNYYENTFFDSTQTRDSTHIEQFIQGLGFQTTLFKHIKINLGLEQKNTRRIVQYSADSLRTLSTSFFDQIVKMEIGIDPRKDIPNEYFFSLGRQYILNGSYQGDDYLFFTLGMAFNKNKKLLLEGTDANRSVPFIYDYYASNHFSWKNSFGKISETQAKLSYTDLKNKFSLGVEANNIRGYVYFDSTFSPKQFDSSLYVRSVFIQKNFRLKHFGFDNLIRWQDVSAKDVLRLPKIITNHSIYYLGKWFKKAVDVQLGFDVTYCSSYYGDAYMPALGQYYLQNEKELGNYPFIDFFFNMQIKNAFVFFKSEHVNSGFSGANYYLAPHMPGPDRSIKIGVKWKFFD